MKLKDTKVLLVGEFDDMGALMERLKKRGAIIATHIERDVECVFVGDGEPGDADNAKELGLRIADLASLNEALEGEEPAPVVYQEESVDVSSMPAYLMEGPPIQDDGYMPNDEDYSDFSNASEVKKSSSTAPKKTTQTKTQQTAPTSAPGANGEENEVAKGDSVKIIGGKQGVGEVGEVFWLGENKYGPGIRAGVKTADGQTYWVDTNELGSTDAVVSETEIEAAKENSKFGKGDSVKITGGDGSGSEGTIFWWGESKFGPGMRAGVEAEDGEKYWVDAEHLEAL